MKWNKILLKPREVLQKIFSLILWNPVSDLFTHNEYILDCRQVTPDIRCFVIQTSWSRGRPSSPCSSSSPSSWLPISPIKDFSTKRYSGQKNDYLNTKASRVLGQNHILLYLFANLLFICYSKRFRIYKIWIWKYYLFNVERFIKNVALFVQSLNKYFQ